MTTEKPATTAALPALRLDEHGRRRVDTTAIMRLAGPLMLNSALQAVLNLTDTWFVGHLSTAAVAAVGAIYWLVIAAILLPGGVALCVQPFVAQEYGAGRRRRAAQTTWMGVWAALATTPVFLVFALLGPALLAPFGLPADLAQLGVDYWVPRMVGGPLAVMLFGLLGFFNGIGRPWLAMIVTALVALVNAVLNPVLIFGLDFGVAGSAWATTVAQGVGVLTAVLLLLSSRFRPRYAAHQVWRPSWTRLRRHFTLGLPMGLAGTADLVALAVFQLLLVRLGTVEGAATQIAMVLTTLAYLPGVGIALAGTTLVGQAIGVGDRDWAYALGNAVIRIDIAAMGIIGLALALAGPWLVPLFVNATDPSAPAVIELALPLLWIAAAYQFFDGLSIGSNYCLRGATDTRVPAVLVTVLAWCLWVPLTHMLTFAPDTGLVGWLPALGYGALGGWVALVIYVVALGAALFLRWRSGAWRRLAVA